jgi:type IV secretion system protein VirB10
MPGAVRAVISRDIFGESGNKILIPRGSRLYGAYSSSILRGQARVQIGWTRLIRPDGVSLNINFTVSDQFGRAGIPGDVDNRYSSVISNSLLTSILTVGGVAAAQKLINNNTNSTTTVNQNQGITTTTTNATNQAVYDVTKTILDTIGQIITNSIDLNPVIRIPQGTKVTVIVNSDIKIPPVNSR